MAVNCAAEANSILVVGKGGMEAKGKAFNIKNGKELIIKSGKESY